MKKKILLLGCALVLAVGAAVAVVLHNAPAAQPESEPTPFPRKVGSPGSVMIKVMQGVNEVNRSSGIPLGLTWEKAPERTSKEGVALSFTGIDVDETEGTVTVNLLLETEKEVHPGSQSELDFFSDGEWYTVFSSELRNLLLGAAIPAMTRVIEPGETKITLDFPKESFASPGKYRVAFGSIAYCTFELMLDL